MKRLLALVLSICLSTSCFADWMGTGFFIAPNGYVATAAHVVQGAKKLIVVYKEKTYEARVVAVDYAHDSAIIQIAADNDFSYKLNLNSRVNDTIFVVGYPAPSIFGWALKTTEGYITAFRGDICLYALACHGNSGGPVVNSSNQVVGVLVAGMCIAGPCSYTTFASHIHWIAQMAINKALPVVLVTDVITTKQYNRKQIRSIANKHNSVVIIFGVEDENQK